MFETIRSEHGNNGWTDLPGGFTYGQEGEGMPVSFSAPQETIYLVRHGRDSDSGALTEEGKEQSRVARDVLIKKNLANLALVLSSDARRAEETAEIIADGLGVPFHLSRRLNTAGNHPYVVEDLDDFLEETLKQLGIGRIEGQPLVVVSHAPLISIAKKLGSPSHRISNGEIVPYAPGSWDSMFFDPYEEQAFKLMLTEPRQDSEQ